MGTTEIATVVGVVVALLGALGTASKLMFDRQEKRIAALETRLEELANEHTDCRVENANLKARVRELERMLGVAKDDDDDEAS